MKGKPLIGWTVLIVLSLFPVLLWFVFGPGPGDYSNYAGITHAIGELTALVAITMFALTFTLSTRIPAIEDYFGGLDKVYIAHGILGSSALILILMHPIFLVLKYIPSNVTRAAIYLLPSNYWSVNFGIIALLGFIILIAITLYSRMKYNHWKFTHEFMGLIFFFAVIHMFLVRGHASRDYIFRGYYIFASVIAFIGLGAFLYSLFLKNRVFKAASYRVSSIRKRTNDTFEIIMSPDHKPISYKSGQFIFIRFYNENLGKEPHPFSIASKSNDENIKIVVKELGDYTKRLSHLREGDKVSIEGPFGRFNYDRKHDKPQVWIAAGIGITPFIGMAEDLNRMDSHDKVDLFYTARTEDDFYGIYELLEIEKNNDNFKVIPWASSKSGRLGFKNIYEVLGSLKGREYYLCGPGPFKASIITKLKKAGISQDDIHSEEFDFR